MRFPLQTFGQRGSALIETIVVGGVVAVVVGGGSALMYLSFAKVWLARAARESSVCLASTATASTCRRKLDRTLRLGLPWGQFEIIEFRKNSSGSRVKLALQFKQSVPLTRASSPHVRIEEVSSLQY